MNVAKRNPNLPDVEYLWGVGAGVVVFLADLAILPLVFGISFTVWFVPLWLIGAVVGIVSLIAFFVD